MDAGREYRSEIKMPETRNTASQLTDGGLVCQYVGYLEPEGCC
jgi:hypothetical protein